jgi:two-component system, cell cycle response regulator DivK
MPHKILIADDNDKNRTLFQDIMIIHGFEVSVASDGHQAVYQARQLMPDLILMDIQMPGMDGIAACRILKEAPETRGIKIIALTSFAMQGDEEKFITAGFNGYLSKPVNTRELPILIKQWLNGEVTE